MIQRDIQTLAQTEKVILAAQLRAAVWKMATLAFAGFTALVGLLMANGATYCALYSNFGPAATLAIVAAFDFLLAAALAFSGVLASRGPPEFALQQRQSALDSLRSQYEDGKNRAASIIRKPFDLAARRTASLMLRALIRNRKSKSAAAD
ncbi:MAG TPA: hypothetical protein VKV96_16005 [Roseiarcus sp.]|nr:hypothetical protein [Roseiarcus sp.]